MSIICIANQKGGVAKSTTVGHLAQGLALRGKRVLVIDQDGQESIRKFCDISQNTVQGTLLDVYNEEAKLKDCILHSDYGFDIITAGEKMAKAEKTFDDPGMLADAIEEIDADYDHILIDNPGNLNILTQNALNASDYLIIPACPEGYEISTINSLIKTYAIVKKRTNRGLKIGGLVITRLRSRFDSDKQNMRLITGGMQQIGVPVFNTVIRECKSIADAATYHENLFTAYKRSNAALDYNSLLNEMTEGGIL